MRARPCSMQGAQRRRLPGTGGSDEQVERQTRAGDAGDRGGLIRIEPDASDLARDVPGHQPCPQRWPGLVVAVGEETLLGVEDVLAGVGDLIDGLEPVALVLYVVRGHGPVVDRGEP